MSAHPSAATLSAVAADRRARTTRAVVVFSVLVVLACVVWAVVAQTVVPDACSLPTPPPRAQFLHCGAQ